MTRWTSSAAVWIEAREGRVIRALLTIVNNVDTLRSAHFRGGRRFCSINHHLHAATEAPRLLISPHIVPLSVSPMTNPPCGGQVLIIHNKSCCRRLHMMDGPPKHRARLSRLQTVHLRVRLDRKST